MRNVMREAVAPLYLLLCLIIGGSAQGVWANMLLQLLGIALIAWAAASRADEPLLAPARQLLWLVLIGVAVVALQLVPLPASVWPHLGGREAIASGYHVLGLETPALPLSLTPHESLNSLLGLIPPLALFCAIVRLRAYRASWLVAALLAGTIAGILLGALQVASTGPAGMSRWYLYPSSSFGFATGFFANVNHMAILLVITLPVLAALLAAARGANVQGYSAIVALVAGAGLVIVVGIFLNRSLAGYGLALPALAASALIVLPPRSALRRWAVVAAAILFVGALAALATSSTRATLGDSAASSVQSRQVRLATTAEAMGDFMPWGSGLGSLPRVYKLYEDRDQVTRTRVVHAHNDYAELALELGLAGILLMIAFLLWWFRAVWTAWRHADAGPYARAASIASAAILAHSLVDFPLRTAAISAAFAMCLALLVERRAQAAAAKSDLRPTRHVVLR